ncbi:hypothetical protein Hdeb2414_s0002g00045551 [Helianthus debilis subsp. tardiflorus]
MKKKLLEDKKRELDAQATAALAKKKSKLKKATVTAPSESEIDLGVFNVKPGNLLEKMYKSGSGSRAPKSGKGTHRVGISQITPLESPPSQTLDLSPPHPDPKWKGKGDDVEVEHVEENVVAGFVGDEGRKDDVETKAESSETTPHATSYTKRSPGAGGGGTSGTRQSPEYQHVEGASWDT